MKLRLRTARITMGEKPVFAVGTYCGARWYWLRSWKLYGLFRKLDESWFFSIGPILFWDGS